MPVGPYDDFDACIADNSDKDDPAAFCGWLEQNTGAAAVLDDGRASFETIDPDDETLQVELSDVGDGPRWEGVLTIEEEVTGDGRMFEAGAVRWETLPVPLRWVREDVGEHMNAVVVGRIDEVYRDGNRIMGRGVFDGGSPEGREAARQVAENLTPGVSVDLDDVSFEIHVDTALLDPDPDAPVELDAAGRAIVLGMKPDDELMVTTDARLRAATIVATPAFAEARIYLHDDDHVYAQQYAPVPEDDMFATPEEAEARAVELGCEGTHAMDEDGVTIYMPCATHDEYDELAGDDDPVPGPDADGLSAFALSASERKPTDGMATEAQRALDWRAAGNAGGEENTVQRARSIASRDALGEDTIRRMAAFFARNASYPTMSGFSPGDDGYPSASRVAWGLWGGDAGQSWSAKLVDRMNRDAAASIVAGSAPVRPPLSWYVDPQLDGPTPVTISEDGRIYGHLATWGTCHTGFVGQCVEPPTSASNYAYFRTGAIRVDDGREIPVGRITLDTTHAGRRLGGSDTAAHYEHTGVAVADVAAGEDVYGIWIAGSIRPGVSDERVRTLSASPLSGDWRRIGGQLELVAALAVNSPGFPIPRALVAGGSVQSLVASGVVAAVPATMKAAVEDSDDAELLRRLIDRERRAAVQQRAAAQAARNRVRFAAAASRARRAFTKA